MFVSKLTRIAKRSSSFNIPKRSFSSLGKNEKERLINDIQSKFGIRFEEKKFFPNDHWLYIDSEIHQKLCDLRDFGYDISEFPLLCKILENQVEIKKDLELLKNLTMENQVKIQRS